MAKVSVSIPDELVAAAKASGLNISGLATAALAAELDRQAKTAELDRYLSELDAEVGPIPEEEVDAAHRWAASLDKDAATRTDQSRRSA